LGGSEARASRRRESSLHARLEAHRDTVPTRSREDERCVAAEALQAKACAAHKFATAANCARTPAAPRTAESHTGIEDGVLLFWTGSPDCG